MGVSFPNPDHGSGKAVPIHKAGIDGAQACFRVMVFIQKPVATQSLLQQIQKPLVGAVGFEPVAVVQSTLEHQIGGYGPDGSLPIGGIAYPDGIVHRFAFGKGAQTEVGQISIFVLSSV